ncbi:MAG: hypothetical protein JW852_03660 [Spirochaetales bacterium]|nr:hypothetical protein [Spirochaetales bacterium]
MSKQTVRFVVIVAIQLVILGVIIFFPERTKQQLFSEYEEVTRPDITMSLREREVDDTVRAIDEAGLFDRYRWTRAVGVETPDRALLVLPDSNLAQYWHFESFLVSAHEAGLGALILDLRDVAEFVPLKAEDGSLRTTNQRMQLFTDAARRWLLGVGFSEIALVSFGTGTQSALDIIEESPAGAFDSWIDVSGMASRERWTIALTSRTSWPRIYLVTGENDRHLADRKEATGKLIAQGAQVTHRIVGSAGPMLLDDEGYLNRDLENEIVADIFRWATRENTVD